MIKLIFAVYDSKAETYNTPFFMGTVNEALRAWADLANDGESQISRYPGDFTLFQLGSVDLSCGKINTLNTPHSLGVAQEFRHAQTIQKVANQ